METPTTRPEADGPGEPATLAGKIEELARHGFAAHFMVADGGLRVAGGRQQFAAAQVRIAAYYRFEGVSDPDDMAILYALETQTGLRGTIADAFGAYADPAVGVFIEAVGWCGPRDHDGSTDVA